MKRIVITGATSFIGIYLLREWLTEDCELFAVVRRSCRKLDLLPENSRLHIIEADMEDYDRLPQIIGSADYFCHLAWSGTHGPDREDASMQAHNYECSLKAFHAAAAMGCSVFLGSGSQAEYGVMHSFVNEAHACLPVTEYGRQKLRTCRELTQLAAQKGMRFVWTRIFSLYGTHDFSGTLVSFCLEQMLRNDPINLTDCTQMWDYLYVCDAAQAMKHLVLLRQANGVYNVASGIVRPLRDFVCDMKEVTGSSSELHFGAVPYGTGGAVDLTPDITKLLHSGWKPQTTFQDGIRYMIQGRKESI